LVARLELIICSVAAGPWHTKEPPGVDPGGSSLLLPEPQWHVT
jgi:hypothetical protein